MEFKFCPFCGKALEQAFAFCPFCGENIGKIIENYKKSLDAEGSDTAYSACSTGGTECEQSKIGEDSKQAALYIENEIATILEYDKKLERGRAMCIMGNFDAASALYCEFIEQYPEKPQGYIGLVRVSSKNYTTFDSDETLSLLSRLAALCPDEQSLGDDAEFADYLFRRELSECVIEDGVLIKYNGNAERLYISEGYITSIKENAFKENTSLVSISIPDDVQAVGNRAFYKCKNLKEAYIGAKEIGYAAFAECKNLSNLILGDQVKIIRESAFYFIGVGAEKASSVFIPESVISVGSKAFESARTYIYCAKSKENTAYWGEERFGRRDWCDWPQNVRYGAKRDDAKQ